MVLVNVSLPRSRTRTLFLKTACSVQRHYQTSKRLEPVAGNRPEPPAKAPSDSVAEPTSLRVTASSDECSRT